MIEAVHHLPLKSPVLVRRFLIITRFPILLISHLQYVSAAILFFVVHLSKSIFIYSSPFLSAAFIFTYPALRLLNSCIITALSICSRRDNQITFSFVQFVHAAASGAESSLIFWYIVLLTASMLTLCHGNEARIQNLRALHSQCRQQHP